MRKLARETYILAALCLADLVSTLWLVSRGQVSEGNPVMSPFLSGGVLPFVLAKTLMVVAPLAILEWARRRQPEFVSAMLRLTIVLYVGVYAAGVWRLNAANVTLARMQPAAAAFVYEVPALTAADLRTEGGRLIARAPSVLH